MINLILPEDQALPQGDIVARLNELYELYYEAEDLEIEAIQFGRLDLLPEIREKQKAILDKIEELEESAWHFLSILILFSRNQYYYIMIQAIDTRNPRHAAAYTLAAGHFLSYLGGYSGQELEALLNLDEDYASPEELEQRSKITLWSAFENPPHPMDDPYLYVADLIENLALDILNFNA